MSDNMNTASLGAAFHRLAREAVRRNPVEVWQTPGRGGGCGPTSSCGGCGCGFDVVLRLDGTYTKRSDAQAVANLLAEALALMAARTRPRVVSFDEIRDVDFGPGYGLNDLVDAIHDQAAVEQDLDTGRW